MTTTEEIVSISATKSIAELKVVAPSVGNFYGWLSEHSHWTYNAHEKAYFVERNKHFHIFADSASKAKALLLLLVLQSVARKTLEFLFVEYLGHNAWVEFLSKNLESTDASLFALTSELVALSKIDNSVDEDFEILASYFSR